MATEEQIQKLAEVLRDGVRLVDAPNAPTITIRPSILEAYPFIPKIFSIVLETIQSKEKIVNDASIFETLISTLEKEEILSDPQVLQKVCASVCQSIATMLKKLSLHRVHSKGRKLVDLFIQILQRDAKDVLIVKSVLACLPKVVMASKLQDGPRILRLAYLCLDLISDSGSKKISTASVCVWIALLRMQLSEDTKSEMCSALIEKSLQVFNDPTKIVAEIMNETDSHLRSKKQDALDAAMGSLIHVLSALETLLPNMTENGIEILTSEMAKLFSLGLLPISTSVCDVFKALFSLNATNDINKMRIWMDRLIGSLETTDFDRLDVGVAFSDALTAGTMANKRRNRIVFLEGMNEVLPYLLKWCFSEYEEVRERSKQNLLSLFEPSPSNTMEEDSDSEKEASLLSSLCQRFETIFEKYEEETTVVLLPVMKMMFQFLGRENGHHAGDILSRLGAFCEAHQESEFDTNQENEADAMSPVQRILGAAVSYLGTSTVLNVLPLKIKEALEGTEQGEPRTYLLPLIKRYARFESLLFWMDHFFPAAQALRERAILATTTHTELEFKCKALEMQIWKTLPSFAIWARDTDIAFESLSELLSPIFIERMDLHHILCSTLARLSACPLHVLKREASLGDVDGKAVDLNPFLHDIPEHFTLQHAQQTFDALKGTSKNWITILGAVLWKSDAFPSTKLLEAFSNFLQIVDPSFRIDVFVSTKMRLLEAFQSTGSEAHRNQEKAFEILCSILPSLDASKSMEIFKIAELIVKSNVDPTIQKKGYKILMNLLEDHLDLWKDHSEEMVQLLVSTCQCCKQPSLKFRLRSIGALFNAKHLQDSPTVFNELVMKFLPEIVIGHHNGGQKVKNAAERILVQIGHIYADRGRFHVLIDFLKDGLDSSEEPMVSGCLTSLSILIENFEVLISDHLSFFLDKGIQIGQQQRCKNTSILLSQILSFLKKVSQTLSVDLLRERLRVLLSYLLEWKAPMQRERKASKELLSLLCDRIGFEEVQKFIPESYGHVMRNLRKQHRRTESQMETSYGPTEMEIPSKTDKARTKSLYSKTESRGASLGNTWKSKSVRSQQPSSIPDSELRSCLETETMENLDLLEPSDLRKLAKAAAGRTVQDEATNEDDKFELPTNSEGKLIINEKSLKRAEKQRRKRIREEMETSEKDDVMTFKSKTTTKKSRISQHTKSGMSGSTKTTMVRSHHSGKRFKAKKGAGGDAKGNSRLEPYAYWKLDRRLLNKRKGKRNEARQDLRKIGSAKKDS